MKRDPHSTPPPTTGGVNDLAPADPREHLEPSEARRPQSLWFLTFVCVFFAWGGYYVQRYSAGYGPLSYNEELSGLGGAKTNAVKPVDPYVLGQRVYGNTCAKCHQADGLGLPGQYPPLVRSEWVLAPGPARVIRIVLDGLQGPIRVQDTEFNNTMTPHRDALTDVQIAAVLTHVRTHREWGHTASPVTPEEVAIIRQKTKARPQQGAWTAAELLALPEHEPSP